MSKRAAQLRIDALEAAIQAGDRVIAGPGADPTSALREASEQLRARLEAVQSRDADSVANDAAVQSLVVRARSAHARVRAAIAEYTRPAPATAPAREPGSPERARELIDRLGLRSCGACQTSDLLLVRSDLALHGPEGSWPVAVVACAACGDVRLRMRDPEALQRARRDPAWEPVALPGVGPFRSG